MNQERDLQHKKLPHKGILFGSLVLTLAASVSSCDEATSGQGKDQTFTNTSFPTRTISSKESPIPTNTPKLEVEIGELREAGKFIFTTADPSGSPFDTDKLWIMNPAGTNKRLLRESETRFSDVKSFEPNRITVLESDDIFGLNWSCLVLDKEGNELDKYPKTGCNVTPDGKKTLFTGELDGDGIYEYNLETGEKKKLIQSFEKTRDNNPIVSLDGRRLIYTHYFYENIFIMYMTDYPPSSLLYSGEAIRLTGGISYARNEGLRYSWSPDGEKLIYSVGFEIGIVDMETLSVSKIKLHNILFQDNTVFEISPDSQTLLYIDGIESNASIVDNPLGIFTVNLDGTNKQLIYSSEQLMRSSNRCILNYIRDAKWVPNTRKISFIDDCATTLTIFDIETEELLRVSNTLGIDSYDWVEN